MKWYITGSKSLSPTVWTTGECVVIAGQTDAQANCDVKKSRNFRLPKFY